MEILGSNSMDLGDRAAKKQKEAQVRVVTEPKGRYIREGVEHEIQSTKSSLSNLCTLLWLIIILHSYTALTLCQAQHCRLHTATPWDTTVVIPIVQTGILRHRAAK